MTNKSLDEEIGCEIEISEEQSFGVFANSFRIVPDTQYECYLDFLVYSATNNRAKVLSRIRVRNDFLVTIKDRLNSLLTPKDVVKVEDGQVHVGGRPLFFMSRFEGEDTQ